MNRKLFVAFILFVFISCISVAGGLPPYKEGELLIRFASAGHGLDSPTEAQRAAARQQVLDSAGGGTVVHLYNRLQGWALVRLPAGQCVESVLPRYASTPGIDLVEPNYQARLCRVPNDTSFNVLWGMQNTGQAGGTAGADVNAAQAWDFETGANQVIVAVTDTGVDYRHPDLVENMWVNSAEFNGDPNVDDDGNGYIDDIYGFDFAGADGNDATDGDGDPCDVIGHGTHVAGTIGAQGNNSIGVTGVCWDVRLMALKIFADDSQFAYTSDEIAAIEYAAGMGADVINASWGGYGFSQALRSAIIDARTAGITFVAAAGNDSVDADAMPMYPAAYDLDNIISVLATNHNDDMSWYSNYGAASVDIGAPGGDDRQGGIAGMIYSTIPGGEYAYNEGTSMAAPHVAGACAMLLSFEPTLTYTEVKNTLLGTAARLDSLSGRCVSGGRMNLGAAIREMAIDEDPPVPNPAQWASWGQPKATGPHSIAMEAQKADDRGTVEYYFECVTDDAFDSGWQSGTKYAAAGLNEATAYTFRVSARDDANNYTDWSVTQSATTGSGPDTLSPFPDPPVWEAGPQIIRLTPVILTMRAETASDESGAEYSFYAYNTPDTNSAPILQSGWQDSATWRPSGGSFTVGNTYYFRFRVRDKSTAQTTTAFSSTESLTLRQGPRILAVPSHYSTIKAAIDAAVAGSGDVVVISPGEYDSNPGDVNLTISKPGIIIRSIDPNDPTIVASTVIDCHLAVRAFEFKGIQDSNTTIAGLTIRNGRAKGFNGNPGDPCSPAPTAGQDGTGGAILCTNSSPTILNCVLDGCSAVGGNAGEPNGNPSGAAPGSGYGGGIYADAASAPIIRGTEIIACRVSAGVATNTPRTFGKAYGGGIYLQKRTAAGGAVIEDCIISGCVADSNNQGEALGGGIYHGLANSQVAIRRTQVIGVNVADRGGGGIYIAPGGKGLLLSDCDISFNVAGGAGGGILYTSGDPLIISDASVISYNRGGSKGGGIFAGDIDLHKNTTVNINDSHILGNSARFGGGIYMDETNFAIIGSEVADNAGEEGAGINAADSDFNARASAIRGNMASQGTGLGGGMALWNTTGRFVNCSVQSNLANGTSSLGGGMYLSGFDSTPKQFVNCLITDNIAGEEGAGLFCHFGAWTDINNCTIAHNEVSSLSGAGGGISCAEYAAYVQLKNSIVYGNDARYGPQLAVGRPSGSLLDPFALIDVEYSDVQGGENRVFIENPDAVAVYFLEGNRDEADPFAPFDVNEVSYYLKQTAAGQSVDSNLVDHGSGLATELEATVGIELTTRTDAVRDTGAVDIGYHYPAEVFPATYQLTIRVERQGDFDAEGVLTAEGFGFVSFTARNEPNTQELRRGTVVRLTAVADPGFAVSDWTGADNVPNTGDPCNIVTMDTNKEVTVSFRPDGFFYLITNVPGDDGRIEYINNLGERVVHPGRTMHREGKVVKLFAVPDNLSHVTHWSGTDDDTTIARESTVTMNAGRNVSVTFTAPNVRYVPGEYTNIQTAIDDAEDGDIVVIAPGTYTRIGGGLVLLYAIDGKQITLTGTDPQDPCVVAATIINNGIVVLNVGRTCRIEGLTFRDFYLSYRRPGFDGGTEENPLADGENGFPTAGAALRLHNYYFAGGFVPPGLPREPQPGSSPEVRNCVFLNLGVFGRDGGAGAVVDDFPGDGGWGGWAHGGAVSLGADSNPRFTNCQFVNCFARGGNGGNGSSDPDGRGGLWDLTDYTNPDGSIGWSFGPYEEFFKYSGFGGAVFVEERSSPEFIDCNFVNCQSYGGASGIGGELNWPPVHWRVNRFGGAVYCADESTATFTRCRFIGNTADVNGPEQWDWESWHSSAQASAESDDEFLSYGGAVAFEDSANVTFIECDFNDNNATVGGAVHWTWADPLFDDCNFIDNSAYHGGGILCVGGSGRIENCRFTGNRATISGGQGGAVALLGTDATVIDTQIIANYSQGSGGGLYISSRDFEGDPIRTWNIVNVENCLVAENVAGLTGGGISSNWHAFTDARLCTIAFNQVLQAGYGGGLYSSNGNYTVIENSIIWGNNAGNGRQIAVRPSDRPAAVMVNYSDIQGGTLYVQPPSTGGNIWVDQGCFFPGPGESVGNIGAGLNDNPLFLSGLLGNYYLSQIATGDPAQTKNSPCVDTGSKSASAADIDQRTTRTDRVPDRGRVDMGFHYPLDRAGARCRVCDLVFDGTIDMADMALFMEQWLRDDCSDNNRWCEGADFNFDGEVNFEDDAFLVSCWMVEDTEPPVPDPAQWRITPYSVSQSQIAMGAETAYDAWGWEVEYRFECITDPNHNRDWSTDPNYSDTGLTSGKQYAYRVRARDGRDPANYTQWSVIAGAVVGADSTPPTPDPMTWQIVPQALSAEAITMTASPATDTSGVEYGFWNLNSGVIVWQNDQAFVDTGLANLVTYTYRTAARDKSANQNVTAWSVEGSATTTAEPNEPNAGLDILPPETSVYPNIYKAAFAVVPTEVLLANGYHHQMTAVTATDQTPPVQYKFICVSDSRFSSGWQTNPFYDVLVSSMQSRSSWLWQVVTRDSVQPTRNVGTLSDYFNCRGQSFPYP